MQEENKNVMKFLFAPIYQRKLFKEVQCFVNAFYSGNISGLDCINDKFRMRQRAEKIKYPKNSIFIAFLAFYCEYSSDTTNVGIKNPKISPKTFIPTIIVTIRFLYIDF